MDDLTNILSSLIGTVRHQTRSEAFSSIINMLDEYGCLDGLESYYNYPECDIISNIDKIEADVIKAFSVFCNKIGINININGAYKDPRSAFVLIDSILNKFDEYEDYESLLNIFHTTDSFTIKFQDMCNLMVEQPIDLTDIIKSVDPKLSRIIDTVFNNKIFEAAKATKEYDAKFLKYVELYPDNPSIWIFISAGSETDVSNILDSLVYPEDINQEYLLEMYTVGLSIFNVDSFDLSYANLEVFLNQINIDELPTDNILLNAYNSLCKIYGKESNL